MADNFYIRLGCIKTKQMREEQNARQKTAASIAISIIAISSTVAVTITVAVTASYHKI